MAKISAAPATFAAALQSAGNGDVILLAGGEYGPLSIARRTFDPPLTIRSVDGATPAKFSKASIVGGTGINLENLVFAYEADQATVADTPVVYLNAANRIEIRGGEIVGGTAVNGVPEDAESLDKSGNVIGWPTARGVFVNNSSDVLIQRVDIHHCHRGIILTRSQRVSILDNDIHHQRKTGIAGGANELRIEANHFHSNRPWRYGQTPVGDHGDWFAIWTDANGLKGVYIRDNLMETGDGLPMMGGWIGGKGVGVIDGWEYTGNTVLGGDHQGFMVSRATNGNISNNTLLQDVVKAKHLGIIVQASASDAKITGNKAGSISDKTALRANTVSLGADPAKAAALRAAWLWQRRGGPPTPRPVRLP